MSRRVLIFLAAFLGAGFAAAVIASHQNSVSVASNPTPAVTTNGAGEQVWSYHMPASSSPTTCTVWLQGRDAWVEFDSSSLDVAPACQSWVQSSAASGELWQLNMKPSDSSDSLQVCSLADEGAIATIYDSGGELVGQNACTRLIAGGWTEKAGPSAE